MTDTKHASKPGRRNFLVGIGAALMSRLLPRVAASGGLITGRVGPALLTNTGFILTKPYWRGVLRGAEKWLVESERPLPRKAQQYIADYLSKHEAVPKWRLIGEELWEFEKGGDGMVNITASKIVP